MQSSIKYLLLLALLFVVGAASNAQTHAPGNYRYGFNGMEKDDEVSGKGNSYTTPFRQYDPRLGRWQSLDPLTAKYPGASPYAGFNNNPIYFADPTGLEGVSGVVAPTGPPLQSDRLGPHGDFQANRYGNSKSNSSSKNKHKCRFWCNCVKGGEHWYTNKSYYSPGSALKTKNTSVAYSDLGPYASYVGVAKLNRAPRNESILGVFKTTLKIIKTYNIPVEKIAKGAFNPKKAERELMQAFDDMFDPSTGNFKEDFERKIIIGEFYVPDDLNGQWYGYKGEIKITKNSMEFLGPEGEIVPDNDWHISKDKKTRTWYFEK